MIIVIFITIIRSGIRIRKYTQLSLRKPWTSLVILMMIWILLLAGKPILSVSFYPIYLYPFSLPFIPIYLFYPLSFSFIPFLRSPSTPIFFLAFPSITFNSLLFPSFYLHYLWSSSIPFQVLSYISNLSSPNIPFYNNLSPSILFRLLASPHIP